MSNQSFYMVWSPQGGAPTKKHNTLWDAEEEAKRLARKEAGSQFYVLEAIKRVEVQNIIVTPLQGDINDDSPF